MSECSNTYYSSAPCGCFYTKPLHMLCKSADITNDHKRHARHSDNWRPSALEVAFILELLQIQTSIGSPYGFEFEANTWQFGISVESINSGNKCSYDNSQIKRQNKHLLKLLSFLCFSCIYKAIRGFIMWWHVLWSTNSKFFLITS